MSKTNLQVGSYGNVDELNSFVGHLLVTPTMHTHQHYDLLLRVQRQLFSVGAMLAQDFERERKKSDFILSESAPTRLEEAIDELEAELSPLTHFILPGGSEAASRAHLCRTVCRRAERSVVLLNESLPIAPLIIIYLNRLSDYFFVLARHLSLIDGAVETIWQPDQDQ